MECESVREVADTFIKRIFLFLFDDPAILPENVSSHLEIMDVDTVDIMKIHIPVWTVEPLDASDLTGLNSFILEQ